MRELADVLAEEKFDRSLMINERPQFIRLIASIVEFVPLIHPFCECRDPEADKFLEVALNGRADVIISGDARILGGEFRPDLPRNI